MSRIIGAVVCGAVFLAGCGGGAAPGAPGAGDFKAGITDAMKPCDDANKATKTALQAYKSSKLSLNEAKVIADAGVAACEAARTARRAIAAPAPITQACMAEADAKVSLATAQRAALDHLMSKPYKSQIDRATDEVARGLADCRKALNG